MRHLPAAAAALLLAAPPSDDHPVMRRILELSGEAPPAPCTRALAGEYARIAAAEEAEVLFVAKDLLDGTCRVVFLGEGGSRSVEVAPEEVARELSDPAAASAAAVHTHPLGNDAYFGAPEGYAGELEFVAPADVAARALDGRGYARQLELVRSGRLPGFNLAPPSTADLFAAADGSGAPPRKPPQAATEVLSSGGRWSYQARDPDRARQALDDLVVFASAFRLLAFPARRSPETLARARAILEEARRDPKQRAWLEEWGEAALALRAPYSPQALAAFEAGDDSEVRAEAAEKGRRADVFCRLLDSIGISASFTPF